MVLALLEQPHLPRRALVDAKEGVAVEDGPGHGVAADAKVCLDIADQLQRRRTHPVALVDKGEDRGPPHPADLEQLAGSLLDTPAVVEQHHRAVGRHQGAVGVLGEVLVARRI